MNIRNVRMDEDFNTVEEVVLQGSYFSDRTFYYYKSKAHIGSFPLEAGLSFPIEPIEVPIEPIEVKVPPFHFCFKITDLAGSVTYEVMTHDQALARVRHWEAMYDIALKRLI